METTMTRFGSPFTRVIDLETNSENSCSYSENGLFWYWLLTPIKRVTKSWSFEGFSVSIADFKLVVVQPVRAIIFRWITVLGMFADNCILSCSGQLQLSHTLSPIV